MELKIDLYEEKKKSLFKIIFGILYFLIVIAWIIIVIIGKTINPFNWISIVVFAFGGVVYIVEGLGYRLESLFGKAYIWINDDFISLKSSAFNQTQLINWNEIQCIEYKLNKFVIQKTDDSIQVIDLSKFEYVLNMKIKETIIDIAKEKNLE